MPASATMKDVAAAAGVSPSTVSNAYNKPEQLSAEVRHRILAKARELGYPGPDAAARSLRSRRAGAIGLLLTPPGSPQCASPSVKRAECSAECCSTRRTPTSASYCRPSS
jgi:DNA-binding LacI/PurR family transcriptional regulator